MNDTPPETEARVLGAIIARPWLIAHCKELGRDDFDDQRNRDVFDAIRAGERIGPLPETAIDMGLAIMRRIDGTPAADRVDLTYVASLALIAELALGDACWRCDSTGDACGTCGSTSDPVVPCRYVLDWFDGEIDALRAHNDAARRARFDETEAKRLIMALADQLEAAILRARGVA